MLGNATSMTNIGHMAPRNCPEQVRRSVGPKQRFLVKNTLGSDKSAYARPAGKTSSAVPPHPLEKQSCALNSTFKSLIREPHWSKIGQTALGNLRLDDLAPDGCFDMKFLVEKHVEKHLPGLKSGVADVPPAALRPFPCGARC